MTSLADRPWQARRLFREGERLREEAEAFLGSFGQTFGRSAVRLA